jgi:hypothetical protein
VKNRYILVPLIAVACCPGVLPAESQSTPTDAEIRALLQANGTENVAAQVGPVAAQQLSLALHRANPALPASADAVVMDVVINYVRRHAEQDHVTDKLFPIYSKYLTKDDVQKITAFYRTPAGRKLVSVMPQISLEGASVGQQWIESILPGLQTELLERLRSEKLIN